ncbi:hypothetical protein Glove_346g144 [Diversispora epigaea]|uniref:Uncharacterized protein n=1 Tax=Diversispora epigaea TaxID=1348612 RepID=A0A397HEY5_9GLOM|nr:hypothetical protein Glove_346g144 [Diversispora epigaea]
MNAIGKLLLGSRVPSMLSLFIVSEAYTSKICDNFVKLNISLNSDLNNRNSLKNQIVTSPSLYTTDGINYYEDSINIYAISKNYILITYLCGVGGNNTRYNACGIIADWLGNVVVLGENCDVNIAQNLNPQSGFYGDSKGIIKELRSEGLIFWDAETLYKGGYLILTENVIESNHTISGRVYNNNGSLHGDWGMPNTYNYTRHVGILILLEEFLSDYRTIPDPDGYD